MKWYNPTSWFQAKPKPAFTTQAHLDSMYRRLDRERQSLAAEKWLAEGVAYAPPFELVNPWAQFYDGFKLLFPLFPARFDYRYSQNYIYLTQGQLDLFRSYARYLYETNAYAQGGLNCLADYTISTGFDYYCQPKRYARNVSKDLVKLCNRHLEDVLNGNCWWMLERELFIRPKRDGDAFLRFFAQEDGITKMRAVEPEQIRNPLSVADDEWSFGIQTDPDDHVEHLAYRIWYDADNPDGEVVPAEEMCMFKNHLDMNVKRGISDFFNLQDLLDGAGKLLRSMREGETVRSSIAYIRQWELENYNTILALQAQNTDYQLPKYNLPNDAGAAQAPFENVTSIQPGEVHDLPQGMEFQNPPQYDINRSDQALQATLRAAAVKWRVPAWVLTGAVDENFAAALVAESPLVKSREWEQHVHIKHYTKVCERILSIAAQQGILPEDILDRIHVCAEGRPIAARNMKEETAINETLYRNKIISGRTWSAREDVDYDEEQDNIRNEPPLDIPAPGALNPTSSSTPGADYSRSTNRPE